MIKGLIVSLIAGVYKVYIEDEKRYINCKPRGVMRLDENSPKVGDIAYIDEIEENSGTIVKVEARKNDLIRPNICNIDQAFVIFSVKEPELNLNLLDKFLVCLEFNNIKPIIVFNKMDLIKNDEKDEILKVIEYYKNIGYETIKTSVITDKLEELKEYFPGKISVFTGQSGVGKSSLLNVLEPSLSLETNEISLALNRGKHTTRHVELIPLFDGWIADTPGFGTINFDEIGMTKEDVNTNFIEFFKVSNECKYNMCMHLNEPNCKVKECVNNNIFLRSRYENYMLFISSIGKDKKNDNSAISLNRKKRGPKR